VGLTCVYTQGLMAPNKKVMWGSVDPTGCVGEGGGGAHASWCPSPSYNRAPCYLLFVTKRP
jgi:hypothetical protein